MIYQPQLGEPLESATVSALRRWLLCHGKQVPTSLKKSKYCCLIMIFILNINLIYMNEIVGRRRESWRERVRGERERWTLQKTHCCPLRWLTRNQHHTNIQIHCLTQTSSTGTLCSSWSSTGGWTRTGSKLVSHAHTGTTMSAKHIIEPGKVVPMIQ